MSFEEDIKEKIEGSKIKGIQKSFYAKPGKIILIIIAIIMVGALIFWGDQIKKTDKLTEREKTFTRYAVSEFSVNRTTDFNQTEKEVLLTKIDLSQKPRFSMLFKVFMAGGTILIIWLILKTTKKPMEYLSLPEAKARADWHLKNESTTRIFSNEGYVENYRLGNQFWLQRVKGIPGMSDYPFAWWIQFFLTIKGKGEVEYVFKLDPKKPPQISYYLEGYIETPNGFNWHKKNEFENVQVKIVAPKELWNCYFFFVV